MAQIRAQEEVKMSDLKELYHYLRVEFEKNRETYIITMNQMNYIEKVIKRFNRINANRSELHSMGIKN